MEPHIACIQGYIYTSFFYEGHFSISYIEAQTHDLSTCMHVTSCCVFHNIYANESHNSTHKWSMFRCPWLQQLQTYSVLRSPWCCISDITVFLTLTQCHGDVNNPASERTTLRSKISQMTSVQLTRQVTLEMRHVNPHKSLGLEHNATWLAK